jgi:hypothetical protein
MKQRRYLAGSILVLATLLSFCMAAFAHKRGDGNLNRDVLALQEFNHRVQQYMKIHHHADMLVPHIKPTSSAKKIIDRKHALAAEIIKERATTQEGNIFTPEVDAYFGRLIHSAYQANSAGIEATLECICPVDEERLKPNDAYPEGAELTPMPSTILLHIPELPPELEYRIVNKDLIIRDREANVIVDILRNAVTPSEGRKLCDD